MMIIPLLIAAALGGSSPAQSTPPLSCSVLAPSILSRTSSGVVQVSNLPLMQLECRGVPLRPMPPSQTRAPLTVEAVVHQISATGAETLVPSAVAPHGSSGDTQSEAVLFYLDIPIDGSERDAASRAFIAEVARRAAESPNKAERAQAGRLAGMDPRGMAQMLRQHRVGLFRVDFRVLDEGRLAGVAAIDVEVVFKGRFFDEMLGAK